MKCDRPPVVVFLAIPSASYAFLGEKYALALFCGIKFVEWDEEGYTCIVSHCWGYQLQLLAWFVGRDEVYVSPGDTVESRLQSSSLRFRHDNRLRITGKAVGVFSERRAFCFA